MMLILHLLEQSKDFIDYSRKSTVQNLDVLHLKLNGLSQKGSIYF